MKSIGLVLAGFLSASIAHAASFDCAMAHTKIEKMICGDAELSKLDEDLGQAYRHALQREDVKQGARESQRLWLKSTLGACQDAACVKQAYQSRIKELGLTSSFGIVMMHLSPGQTPPPPASAKPAAPLGKPVPMAVPHPKASVHPAVCDAVLADSGKSGKLENLGDGPVEINIKGKKETIVITQEGSGHFDYLNLYAGDGKPIDVGQSQDAAWDKLSQAALHLIRFEGKIYIVGSYGLGLAYVSTIDKDNVENLVCQFDHPTPFEAIAESHNDKLCKLGLVRNLDYVAFDKPNPLEATPPYWGAESGEAASVDIDNDGKPDLVVKYMATIPGTGGCDNEALGVINRVQKNLDATATNQMPDPECGLSQSPFLYAGQAYIEIRYTHEEFPTNNHKIVQLRKGQLSTVCNYDVRATQHVLGDYDRIVANATAAYKDPWVYALEMPGTDGIQVLLDAGQDMRIEPGHNAFGSVINEAINRGRYDVLRLLLDHGADPNLRPEPPLDQPPLVFAVWRNSREAVQLLLAHGADPTQVWGGRTALQWVDTWVNSESDRAVMRKLLSAR